MTAAFDLGPMMDLSPLEGDEEEAYRGVKDTDDDPILSPSQVDDYNDCPRKWGWRKLGRKPKKTHPSAVKGRKVHGILEGWLRHGIAPDESTEEGAIAMHMIPELPTPGTPGLEIEEHFLWEHAGFKYQGLKDLRYWHNGVRIVHDHKTTSQPKYFKTPEILRQDVQGVIYAAHELEEQQVKTVDLCWLYGLTGKKRRTHPVRLTVIQDEVLQEMPRITALAREMVQLRRQNAIEKIDVKDLPYNVETCEKYGGCGFKDCCNLSPAEMLSALMSFDEERKDPMATIAEKLRARIQAQPVIAQAAVAPPVPQAAPVTVPLPGPVTPATPGFQGYPTQVQVAPVVSAQAQTAAVSIRDRLGLTPSGLATGINPPAAVAFMGNNPAPVTAPAIQGTPAHAVVVSVGEITQAYTPEQIAAARAITEAVAVPLRPVQAAALAEAQHGFTEPTAPADPQPKPRRGRPTKAEQAAKLAAAATQAAGLPLSPRADDSTPTVDSLPLRDPSNGFVLCVDCNALRGFDEDAIVHLHDLLTPVLNTLKAEKGIGHYKSVEYGKGVAHLNDALAQYIQQVQAQGFLGSDMIVVTTTKTPEGADTLNTLRSFSCAEIG